DWEMWKLWMIFKKYVAEDKDMRGSAKSVRAMIDKEERMMDARTWVMGTVGDTTSHIIIGDGSGMKTSKDKMAHEASCYPTNARRSNIDMGKQWRGRTIIAEDNEIYDELLGRSVVGEVKARFETYVKAKYLDLWHIFLNGDFPSLAKNEVTQILEDVPFEEQSDDLKKKLAKNNEAKMVLYNALPKKEYERIFMCKTTKDIWQLLLITHQVLKLLMKVSLARTTLGSFFRALHPKWRAKVTEIKELKDLSSLALDELIENLKVHEVVMEKDFEIYKGKKERIKSIALKAKKESNDDKTSTSESNDEEYAMVVMNFKKFFRRKGKFVRQPREERKSLRQRDEKKGNSDRKYLDSVIQVISLAIVQKHLATKIKGLSLEVLEAIARKKPKTKPTTKLVSWLNRQMR
nr:zf-CCHC domain-containing protein/DUF4219 domain-containing protein/UBN2 domain-containing protein [Tanacetum cinerariifolium]